MAFRGSSSCGWGWIGAHSVCLACSVPVDEGFSGLRAHLVQAVFKNGVSFNWLTFRQLGRVGAVKNARRCNLLLTGRFEPFYFDHRGLQFVF